MLNMKKMSKIVITAAITGGATRKENNPNVPYTPEEMADECEKCYREGASVVHIHAKNLETGYGTIELEAVRAVYDAVVARCPEMIINISSADMFEPKEKRVLPITTLKPEMCSFNTNSMNFAFADYRTGQVPLEVIYRNTFEDMVYYAQEMKGAGVRPEFEIFDPGGFNNVVGILDRQEGLFHHPMHFQFVYGVAGGMAFEIPLHTALVGMLPSDSTWSVCGVGPNQMPAAFMAAIGGGHIRVGLEDNIRNPDNSPSRGSYEQVIWARQLAELTNRGVATPSEARVILGLPERTQG